MSKEFGIYPNDIKPKLWWGARAIATDRKYGLDIPWNRQNFEGNGDDLDKEDFLYWLNNVALPKIDKMFKSYESTKGISIDSENGCFHCEADDKCSGGYLYIGAWITENNNKGE